MFVSAYILDHFSLYVYTCVYVCIYIYIHMCIVNHPIWYDNTDCTEFYMYTCIHIYIYNILQCDIALFVDLSVFGRIKRRNICQRPSKGASFQCLSLGPSHVCRPGIGQRTQPKTRASEVGKWTDWPQEAGFPDRKTPKKASRISRSWLQQSGYISFTSIYVIFLCAEYLWVKVVSLMSCSRCPLLSRLWCSQPNDVRPGPRCHAMGPQVSCWNLWIMPWDPEDSWISTGGETWNLRLPLNFRKKSSKFSMGIFPWNTPSISRYPHVWKAPYQHSSLFTSVLTTPAPVGTGASAAWQASRAPGGVLLADFSVSTGLSFVGCWCFLSTSVIFTLWFIPLTSLTITSGKPYT